MTSRAELVHGRRAAWLAFRYAVRELRGGLSGFYIFMSCIAIGVMAIAGVGSVAASLSGGLAREGRTLLGGDVAFSLVQREADANEIAFLRAHGQLSAAATLNVMARSEDGRLALVDLKAVDGAYPMVGEVGLDPPMPMPDLLSEREGDFGTAVDVTLLARLDLKLGDRITIGGATFQIRSKMVAEPDKLAGNVGLGPRVLVGEQGLRATGLLRPGSLVRWVYRVKLPDDAAGAAIQFVENARRALPQSGWEIRSRGNASPQLEGLITRLTEFLTLVGLAALLVGGIGVANAIKSHIDRRRVVIASFKAMGATGREVFTIYLMQVILLAGVGSVVGLVAGAALPFLIVGLLGDMLPLPLMPALHLDVLAQSFIYGLLTALAFGLWPLAQVHDVPVAALFRVEVAPEWYRPRWSYVMLMAAVTVLLVIVVMGLAYDRRVASAFVVASIAVFALLRGVATALMALARRLPRSNVTVLRLAIANIHRPGALTPSVVMSLGLGLAVLVTITQIDGNLRRQFMATLPERAPSFYFIDIPKADAERFGTFLRQIAPQATIDNVPMLRGRIVAARGVKAEELNPAPQSQWALLSDRGLTYTNEIPKGSKVVEGEWWSANYNGPPLVSMEKKIAEGLKLKIGDQIVVNVLGRDVPAKISNFRVVDWQSLGINSVLVFSPNVFRGAPHSHVATLSETRSDPLTDTLVVKQVADAFPTVTSVRVREALETVGTVVANLVLAIRGASAITLISAILVLGGALAAGHRHRLYDAVILKTLGATRTRLLGGYVLEYLMIGLATAVFGVTAGSIAAWLIVTRLMMLEFIWQAGSAAGVIVAVLIVTVGLGLAGTLLALNQKPARVLRNL